MRTTAFIISVAILVLALVGVVAIDHSPNNDIDVTMTEEGKASIEAIQCQEDVGNFTQSKDDNNGIVTDETKGDSWSPRFLKNDPRLTEHYEYFKNDLELTRILDSMDDNNAAELYHDIRREYKRRAKLETIVHDSWGTFTYWQLHAYFGCKRVFAGRRYAYDAAKWADVRQFWHQFKREYEERYPQHKLNPRTFQYTTASFDMALEPFQSGEKGRGLRAARDISKGELVFTASNNTIVFTHGHTWREMLFEYYEIGEEDDPMDAETACDLLVWSWVQPLDDGTLYILMDLDNGSLLNEGRDEPGWEKPNVICGKEEDGKCMQEYYATKDIKNGEELLCDYREFAWLDSWADMGL